MCEEFPDDLMRLGDVAALLGVHVGTIHRWLDAGKVACYRIAGSERRISRRDAVALVQPEKSPAAQSELKKDARRESLHERDRKAKKLIESLKRHGLDKYL